MIPNKPNIIGMETSSSSASSNTAAASASSSLTSQSSSSSSSSSNLNSSSLQTKRKPKIDSNNKGSASSSSTTSLSNSSSSHKQHQQSGTANSSGGGSLTQHHHHSHHHHQSQSQQPQPHYLHQALNDSKFYSMTSIEMKDSLEATLEECFNKLKHLICPSQLHQQPDSYLFNELSNYSNQSKVHYEEVCNALLYSILIDPSNSSRCLRNLFLCNNLSFNFGAGTSLSSSISQSTSDAGSAASSIVSSTSYGVLINNLQNIITENYFKLQDTPRQQLVWLLRELVKARVNQSEKLILQMLRNVQSGSLTDKNIWLAESLLEILHDQTSNSSSGNASNTSSSSGSMSMVDSSTSSTSSSITQSQSLWIYTHNELMTQSVYTYLRIIADHAQAPALGQLRQRETEFCVQVLRDRWNECMLIGRDLVRLLQNVAKIADFEQLWRDLIQSPQILSPQFAQLGGLSYLLRLPTRRRCLISRLTIDMERKIYFIITSVKAGQQKRYQDWFQRQFLNTPESQSLRVDLIRYICVVVHPTNEQLNSGLTPRWALCGWLINTCTNPIDSANLKLALFFDWLLYDAKKDNIMLIEPAILLMYNSIRVPASSTSSANFNLTSMLFDFLCRVSLNYHWPLRDQILNGIMQSFKDSVEKRVIPSMQAFFGGGGGASSNESNGQSSGKFGQSSLQQQQQQQQPGLDRDLRNLIQTTFGNFFQTLNLGQPIGQQFAPISPVSSALLPISSPKSGPYSPTSIDTLSSTNSNSPFPSSTSNFSSNFSSFKRKAESITSEDSMLTSSSSSSTILTSNSSNFTNSNNDSSSQSSLTSQTFQNQIKTELIEPISFATSNKSESTLLFNNELQYKSETQATFSSDDEDTNQSTKSTGNLTNQNNPDINQPSVKPTTINLPPSILNIQKQLQQFTIKPFKIFSTIDDANSIINALNSQNYQNNLENHLALIPSDDVKDKLSEFYEKVKELTPTASISLSTTMAAAAETNPPSVPSISQPSANILSNMFKDILNMIHRDPEFLNNSATSLSDLAVSICLILRNDFTNNLLPSQFYSAASSLSTKTSSRLNGANNSNNNNNNNTSLNNDNEMHCSSMFNLFSPTSNILNLVNESINQRPIFVLFKELSHTTNQSNEREILIQLLHEIYLKQARIGYYFLFYIYAISLRISAASNSNLNTSNVSSQSNEIASLLRIYSEFSKERQNEIKNDLKNKNKSTGGGGGGAGGGGDDDENDKNSNDDSLNETESDSDNANESDESKSNSSYSMDSDTNENLDETEHDYVNLTESDQALGECFMQDIRLCQQDDPHLFCFILPFICGQNFLPIYMINNSELVYLIVSCIDARQLKDLISSVISQDIVLLKRVNNSNTNKQSKTNVSSSAGTKRSTGGKSGTSTGSSSLNRSNEDAKSSTNKKRKRTTSTGNNSSSSRSKDDDTKARGSRSNKERKSKKKKAQSSQKDQTKKRNLFSVLEASLLWETIEQIFFWQIVNAHDDIGINYMLPLLNKLDANCHAEAIMNLFQLLKTTEPTFDLVRFIVRRRIDDNMERALFIYWTRKTSSGETKMSQIFTKLLYKSALNNHQQTTIKKIKYIESFTNNKKLTAEQQLEIANQQKAIGSGTRVGGGKQNAGKFKSSLMDKDQMPTLDQILFHLNRLRMNNDCINFILKENLLEMLQKVYKKYCDEETKKKYADLFTLADEFNDNSRNDSQTNENDDDDDENENENSEDENEDSDSNESDSNETSHHHHHHAKSRKASKQASSRLAKQHHSQSSSKLSTSKTTTSSNSTSKSSGTKRTLKQSATKSNSKKQKLRNANSSDSDYDDDEKSSSRDNDSNSFDSSK